MSFRDIQDAWQNQEDAEKITIPIEALLGEVRRNKVTFERAIFRRDILEIGTAFVLTGVFSFYAQISGDFMDHKIWTWYIMAAAVLFVGMFFLCDRIYQRRKQAVHTQSLRGYITASLAQVNHQIWLLQNILWWYILPPSLGALFPVMHMGIVGSPHFKGPLMQLLFWACILITPALLLVVDYLVYHLNVGAVSKELLPRKAELENLLASLE